MSTQQVAPSPSTPPPPTLTFEQAQERFLQERNTFIGGSEIYQLFNIEQYGRGCARALGYQKLNYEPEVEPTPEDEALFARGHLLEPIIATIYQQQTGRVLRRASATDNFGFPLRVVRDKQDPFLGVHTDRIILAGDGRDPFQADTQVQNTGDAEIKSHGEGYFWQIRRKGAPPGHLLQVQHSNLVTKHPWGSLIILGVFGSLPVEYFDMAADPAIHERIRKEGGLFWNLVMGKNELPQRLADSDDMRCKTCAYRMECRGEQIDASAVAFMKKQTKDAKDLVQITADEAPELTELAMRLGPMESEKKALTTQIEAIHQEMLTIFGTRGYSNLHKPYFPGLGAVQLSLCAFNGLDQTKLKAEEPEIYERFYVKGRVATPPKYFMRWWPEKLK